MKRCLNCMEEYNELCDRCPQCYYHEGAQERQPWILEEGIILQKRYIVGTYRRIRECDVIYVGWDALFERKVLIQEFFPRQCVTREADNDLVIFNGKTEFFNKNLNFFVNYHKKLIQLYKEDDIICEYSCFQENGTAYATMQYSEAETLKEWLKHCGKVRERECIDLIYQATEALKKVHALKLVHGDVGLESFWITNTGNLVLKDFAEPCHDCGNPMMQDYGNAGPWVDVYGLTVLFGKILLAQDVFNPDLVYERLSARDSGLPQRVLQGFEHGIAIGADQRIQTLEDFSHQMFGDSATMRLVTRSRRQKKRRHKRAGRINGKVILLGIVMIAVGLAAALGYRNHEKMPDGGVSITNEVLKSDAATPSNAKLQELN